MVTRFPVVEIISGGCLVGGGQGNQQTLTWPTLPWRVLGS